MQLRGWAIFFTSVVTLVTTAACGPSAAPASASGAASASAPASETVPAGAAGTASASVANTPTKVKDPNAASMAKSERHDAIHKVLRSKRDVYRACFNTAHKAHPELEFAVVTFAIDLKPSGEIESIKRVEGTPSEQEDMVTCMTDAIKSLTFPAHPKGKETKVRYPLEYNSR